MRFQAHLLDAVGEAIIATDLIGTVIYWGPGAERLYGWSATEVQGRCIVDVIPAMPGRLDSADARARLARGEPWAGVMERRRKDGSTFFAQLSVTPVLDDVGHFMGNISVSA